MKEDVGSHYALYIKFHADLTGQPHLQSSHVFAFNAASKVGDVRCNKAQVILKSRWGPSKAMLVAASLLHACSGGTVPSSTQHLMSARFSFSLVMKITGICRYLLVSSSSDLVAPFPSVLRR